PPPATAGTAPGRQGPLPPAAGPRGCPGRGGRGGGGWAGDPIRGLLRMGGSIGWLRTRAVPQFSRSGPGRGRTTPVRRLRGVIVRALHVVHLRNRARR